MDYRVIIANTLCYATIALQYILNNCIESNASQKTLNYSIIGQKGGLLTSYFGGY